MDEADLPADITVGQLFEDCRFEPMICTGVSVENDDVFGISLIDGRGPAACSLRHCGPEPISVAQAVWIKANFSAYVAARKDLRDIVNIVPASTERDAR